MARQTKLRSLVIAAIALFPATAMAIEVADVQPLLDSLPPGMLKHGKPFTDDAEALAFPDVVVLTPDGGQFRADAVTIAALDVAAILADTVPENIDIAVTGLTLSAETMGMEFDIPWPFKTDSITGDLAFRFASQLNGDARIEASLDSDFGSDGIIHAATALVQPSWLDIPLDPSDPFATMIPQSVDIQVTNIAVPEMAFALLTGEPGIWGHGPLPVAIDFAYLMDEAAEDVLITGVVDLGSGTATMNMSGWPSPRVMSRPELFYDDGLSTLLTELAWKHAKFAYADSGLAGALLDLLAVMEGDPLSVCWPYCWRT